MKGLAVRVQIDLIWRGVHNRFQMRMRRMSAPVLLNSHWKYYFVNLLLFSLVTG